MAVRESEIKQLVSAMLDRLAHDGFLTVTGGRAALERRLADLLLVNFREEEEINRQARVKTDEIERSHGREMVGMSRQKIFSLVKERLAKEKGFIL